MAPSPTPPPPGPTSPRPRRPLLWLWVGLAFLVGIVLFLAAIRGSRQHGDFFRAGEVPPSTAEPAYAPLPAPMAGDEGSGIGPLDAPAPVADESAPVERPLPAPPVPIARPAAPPARKVAGVDRKARPIPGATPAPAYPMRALRDGESGTALVLVHIGPDGIPTATELAQSSGSRELDRAALQGVRRWRFEPAMADGHPTVGEVVVPIDFRLSD